MGILVVVYLPKHLTLGCEFNQGRAVTPHALHTLGVSLKGPGEW